MKCTPDNNVMAIQQRQKGVLNEFDNEIDKDSESEKYIKTDQGCREKPLMCFG